MCYNSSERYKIKTGRNCYVSEYSKNGFNIRSKSEFF